MSSVDDMVAGGVNKSGSGGVAAGSGKRVKKGVVRVCLAVFLPIILILFIALVVIIIIAYWITQISNTASAIARALDNYTYYLQSQLDDDAACRLLRIQDADNIWDLCAADVAVAIDRSYVSDFDLGSGFYSKEDLVWLLKKAAEYETDESLTGVYYNSSYTRTFQIDELFFIYLEAYQDLCIEGKMPGGDANSIKETESGVVENYGALNDTDTWDWIYAEYDTDLYNALCELDEIVEKYSDGLIVETYSAVTNDGIADSGSNGKTYKLDLSYLVYPFEYSCGYTSYSSSGAASSGNHSTTFEQSAYDTFSSSSADRWYDSEVLAEMAAFVGEMEEWFNGNSQHGAYGELVNYDPVLEYIWYETDVSSNISADEFYSLTMYDTDLDGGTGLDFYDTYMKDYGIDEVRMAALWYARGYSEDNYWELSSESSLASDITNGWLYQINNPYNYTNTDTIDDITEYGYNGYGSESFYAYFQLHIYGGNLISFGSMQNAEKLTGYGEEGEEATLYTVYDASNDTSTSDLWTSNRGTMIQSVSISVANDYINLSIYDLEREYGVTWKLLLAVCMAHDLENGNIVDDVLVLDPDFCELAAETLFASSEDYADNYVFIEGNSIEEQESIIIDYLTESGEGNCTLSSRQGNPLSAEYVKAMTHYNSDDSSVYCIGEGYYTSSSSVPSFGLQYYSSLLADVVTVVDNEESPTKIVDVNITYHADELYDAIKELGFEDGIDDVFIQQAILALSGAGIISSDVDMGVSDEVDRYAEIAEGTYEVNEETGECEPTLDCLTQIIYLSDTSLLVKDGTTSADTSLDGNSTSSYTGSGTYYPQTYFYNLSGTVLDSTSGVTVGSVITQYGLKAYSELAWYTQEEAEQIAEETGYLTSSLFYKVDSTGKRKTDGASSINRYRELTDDEIELIMSQVGLSEPDDSSETGSMYSVILTALQAVGNIEYQNTPRSITGGWYWSNVTFQTNLINMYQTQWYFDSNTYPYAGSGNSYLYGFSADCSSFVAWLFHIAGNGIYDSAIGTGTYVSHASAEGCRELSSSSYGITGISYVGTYTSTAPSLGSLQAGDIIILTPKNSDHGHAMLYIGAVDNGTGTTFTAVDCNGEQDASSWGLRGNVYYGTQNFDMSKYNYYIFRIDIPNYNRYITQ